MFEDLIKGWDALKTAASESQLLQDRLALLRQAIVELAQQRMQLEAEIGAAKNDLDKLRKGQQVSFLSSEETWVVIGAEGPDSRWRSGTQVIVDLKHTIEHKDARIKRLEKELNAIAGDLVHWSSTIAQRRKSEIEALVAGPPAPK